MLQVNEIEAKTILTKSGLPGSDWVINPYNGCQFSCQYCYAAQIGRWKHPDEEWGSYLDVKINAADVLQKELVKLQRKFRSKDWGSIFLASVTDPYTGLEVKYQITRKCLEELVNFGYEGQISIQTKSPLVTKDIEILKKLKKLAVGFTITTLDDKVSRFLETMAPPVSARIEALEKLHEAGIETYAFIGPILPHFVNNKEAIEKILDQLEKVGVNEVWFEQINLSPKIKERLLAYVKKETPELLAEFQQADNQDYRDRLNLIISQCLKGRKLKLGLGKVIYHHDLAKKK